MNPAFCIAKFRAMQLLAPFPNGSQSLFISLDASVHRSGRNSCGSGNTVAEKCKGCAETPATVPAGRQKDRPLTDYSRLVYYIGQIIQFFL